MNQTLFFTCAVTKYICQVLTQVNKLAHRAFISFPFSNIKDVVMKYKFFKKKISDNVILIINNMAYLDVELSC